MVEASDQTGADGAGSSQAPTPSGGTVGRGVCEGLPGNVREQIEPHRLTLDDYLAMKPVILLKRPMTLNEWRAQKGYTLPLSDHGDFRKPHGISGAERRRMDARLNAHLNELARSCGEFEALPTPPTVTETIDLGAIQRDSGVRERYLAIARLTHKHAVIKAIEDSEPVRPEVWDRYRDTLYRLGWLHTPFSEKLEPRRIERAPVGGI